MYIIFYSQVRAASTCDTYFLSKELPVLDVDHTFVSGSLIDSLTTPDGEKNLSEQRKAHLVETEIRKLLQVEPDAVTQEYTNPTDPQQLVEFRNKLKEQQSITENQTQKEKATRLGKVYRIVGLSKFKEFPDILPGGERIDYLSIGHAEEVTTPKAKKKAGNSANVVLLSTSLTGRKRVLKPLSGERNSFINEVLFENAVPGAQGHREVLVSEVAQLLGATQFPEAKFVDFKHPSPVVNGTAVQIEFLPGETLHVVKEKNADIKNSQAYRELVEIIHIIDFLIGNHDRHSNNYLIFLDENGELKVFAIDHGMSFTRFTVVGDADLSLANNLLEYHKVLNHNLQAEESEHKHLRRIYERIATELHRMLENMPQRLQSNIVQKIEKVSEEEWRKLLNNANARYQKMHPQVSKPLLSNSDIEAFLLRRNMLIKEYEGGVSASVRNQKQQKSRFVKSPLENNTQKSTLIEKTK